MSIYRTCPHCGANLDPGETCDCASQAKSQTLTNLDKKTARGADDTTDGKETQHDA